MQPVAVSNNVAVDWWSLMSTIAAAAPVPNDLDLAIVLGPDLQNILRQSYDNAEVTIEYFQENS